MSRKHKSDVPRVSRQPSHEDQQRVADAFDPARLAHLCSTWDFTDYATKVPLAENRWGDERFYWYKDNGSDILAVAHLDSVQDDTYCQVVDTAAGYLATSGALDDRLGVYVILELLPALGITCDWLLTTDEESAQSTARDFQHDFEGKQYNWIIEFDRGGTDVVMYQFETAEYADLVKDSGARVGMGSYSDIADLDLLGCAAFNWGVGYQDYHSARSHAWLNDTFRSVARFVKFHAANADTHLPHEDWRAEIVEDDDDWLLYDRPGAIDADCGHMVDLEDTATYVEIEYGSRFFISCHRCENEPMTIENTEEVA